MSDPRAFPARAATIPAITGACAAEAMAGLGKPVRRAVAKSNSVWPRMLILLVGLFILKLVLIAGQGQNLYEAHWRIGGPSVSRIDELAFYGFVLLGGLSIVRLARECRSIGKHSVRTVNAVVLILGLVFILLKFHNGNRNYLYPILDGVLKWNSVGPYVANSLFFNQPFLAGWLFVYAAAYYVLARTGQESRVLSLTLLFACAYALIYLRDLIVQRDELLVIDCLGALCWFVTANVTRRIGPSQPAGLEATTPARPSSLPWLLAPLAWLLFFCWVLLRFDTQWHSHAAAYFLRLIALTLALFAAATFLVRRLAKSQTWIWLLPFFGGAFFLFTNSNYPSSENYNHLICLALTFPRYFLGDLFLVGMVGLAGFGYRQLRPRCGLWWLDVAVIGLLIIAGIDLRLSQIMGIRLGWDVLSFGDSPKMMLRMAKPFLPGAVMGLLMIVVLYLLGLRAARAWTTPKFNRAGDVTGRNGPSFIGRRASATFLYLCLLFISLALLGAATAPSDKAEGQPVLRLVQTSPLWKRVARRTLTCEQFLDAAKSLRLGDFRSSSRVVPGQPPRDLNVLVVFMESSYNQHLSLFGSSEQTQPLLERYKDRMELFPNFFSAYAGSIHARFATFTSLYPVQDFHAFTQEHVPVKSLFEILHDRGYTCSMFYSSFFDYTGFRDFLKNRGLDEMYDADTMPGQRGTERVEWGLLEGETLGAIRSQIQKYAHAHQRFCLTYVPAAPHYPYDRIPKNFQKNKMIEFGNFTPSYLNELLYMDWVISSILDQLKECGLLDQTLVVITNDHGEMLGGKDKDIGHGWAITPQLANTPLLLLDPQRPGFHVNKTIGTQVDLLPTILDRLNIPVPADELYEGISLDAGPARAGRFGYLNSYRQFGIIADDQIVVGDRDTGSSSGPASTSGVYTITNEGSKTLFTQSAQSADIQDRKAAMARFDAFQETFLRDYAFYREAIRGAARQQTKR